MQKELSMTRISEALCLAAVLTGIAALAVFDVIPAEIAQYVPLAVAVWVVRRSPSCALRKA
jgi:hypothetical protein